MKNYFTWPLLVFLLASIPLHAQELNWAKSMGSPSGESSYAIAVDNEGNSYSVGTFSLTADFDPGPGLFSLTSNGFRDIYISKLDNDGEFVWAKQIGGTMNESAYAITLDPSGYIYFTGPFRDTVDFDPSAGTSFLYGHDRSEVFIAKFDFDGNFIWAHPVTRSLDTISSSVSYAIRVDPLGSAYVLGRFGTAVDFDPGTGDETISASGEDDIFVSKYDDAGNFIWVKTFGGPEEQEPYAMAIDHQGNIYCTGNFSHQVDFDPGPLSYVLTAQDTLNDAFILKLNSSGEFLWVKQISGPGTEFGFSIAVDQNGNSYTSGSYDSQTDFNYGNSPILLPNSGYLDGYILALKPDGQYRWVERITGPDDQEVWGITSSPGPNGGLYATGYFIGQTSVDDFGIPILNSINNGIDVFISKMDFSGNFKFLVGIAGPSYQFSQAIAVNSSMPNTTIYSTGYYSGTCDFDPGTDEYPLTSAGSTDAYVVKLDDLTTGIENLNNKEAAMDIQVYPNPAHSDIDIQLPGIQQVKMKLTNSLGVETQSFETNIENEMLHLDVSALPAGTYFLQLSANEKIWTKKIMVLH